MQALLAVISKKENMIARELKNASILLRRSDFFKQEIVYAHYLSNYKYT